MSQPDRLAQQSIPAPIQWAISVYGERLHRATALGNQIAHLELRMAEAEQRLQQLRSQYAAVGREHTAVHSDAELLLVMIQEACGRVGIEMPLPADQRLPDGPRLAAVRRREPATPRAIGRSAAELDGRPDDRSEDQRGAEDEAGPFPESGQARGAPAEPDPDFVEGDVDEPRGSDDSPGGGAGGDSEADDDASGDAEDAPGLAQAIRDRHGEGAGERTIARELNIDRRKVKEVIAQAIATKERD